MFLSLPPVPAVFAPAPTFFNDDFYFHQQDDKPKFNCKKKCTPPVKVPGPLPIFGVVSAFAYSRKLKARIRESVK